MINPIIYWTFDPIAISAGPISIHWYGLCWLAAFLQGQFLTQRFLRAAGRTDVDVGSLMMWAIVGTIAGARLAHCLFYDPAYYLNHPLKILAVWEGGMASHGGAAGLVIALLLAAPRYARGLPFLTLLDAVAIPAALGGAIIRIANFLNSEIIGLPDTVWIVRKSGFSACGRGSTRRVLRFCLAGRAFAPLRCLRFGSRVGRNRIDCALDLVSRSIQQRWNHGTKACRRPKRG